MKTILLMTLSFGLTSIQSSHAEDSQYYETRVKADLDESLSRILSKDQYSIQVIAETETVTERKLLEGETLTGTPEKEVIVPPLPGFEPPPHAAENKPTQTSRQVYKNVDKEVLKKVMVNLNVDEQVPETTRTQARSMADQYLSLKFGNKSSLNITAIKMKKQEEKESASPSSSSFSATDVLKWTLIGLGLLTFFGLGLRLLKKSKLQSNSYAPVYDARYSRSDELPMENDDKPKSKAALSGNQTLALPELRPVPSSGESLSQKPATFVEKRVELLNLFLGHSDTFRNFYLKLDPNSKDELYLGLRGPAYDSLLKTLQLDIPAPKSTNDPTEDQLNFHAKTFSEFVKTFEWQTQQFFGFLHQMSVDQLITLSKNENPLIGAILLKFMSPDHSAKVLEAIDKAQRQLILTQFGRIGNLSSEELSTIEKNIREKTKVLPKLMGNYNQEDLHFWTQILSRAEDQEAILNDLEKARPDLYPRLAKYRFKLEDLPALPQSLLHRTLDQIENDELAKALLTTPKDVSAFVLEELSQDRKRLVSSQMMSFSGLPEDSLKESRINLTLKLREVMV